MKKLKSASSHMLAGLFSHLPARLALPVTLVGLGCGMIGAAFVLALHFFEHLLGPGQHGPWMQAGILVGVGGLVALGVKLLGPTGNIEILVDNIHVEGGAQTIRETRSMVPISILCVAAGGGMGPEAPLVQTSGLFGSWMARRFQLNKDDMRILTVTGMAAGFTVLFGAPLGSVLFALEILHRRGLQYYEAIMPAALGALAGYAVYLMLSGAGMRPAWAFPPIGELQVADFGWAVGIGVAGALGGMLFALLQRVLKRGFGALPEWSRPVAGGGLLAALGAWTPYALTYGEVQAEGIIAGKIAVLTVAVALCGKLLGTAVTLASGWKGGFIVPLFFMGACLGQLTHHWFPQVNEVVAMSSFMVALCVAVTKTPLGSTLVVTQMGGLPLMPTALISSVTALLLSNSVNLFHTQRERAEAHVAPTH